MTKPFKRIILIYKDFFPGFYKSLSKSIQKKIDCILELISERNSISQNIIESIEHSDGLRAINVKAGNKIFLVFCFFEFDNVIILLNGFQKIMSGMRKDELKLASKIRKEYYFEKRKDYTTNVV